MLYKNASSYRYLGDFKSISSFIKQPQDILIIKRRLSLEHIRVGKRRWIQFEHIHFARILFREIATHFKNKRIKRLPKEWCGFVLVEFQQHAPFGCQRSGRNTIPSMEQGWWRTDSCVTELVAPDNPAEAVEERFKVVQVIVAVHDITTFVAAENAHRLICARAL